MIDHFTISSPKIDGVPIRHIILRIYKGSLLNLRKFRMNKITDILLNIKK